MTTYQENNVETSAGRCTILFRCYWCTKSLNFLAQVFCTSKADIPDIWSFSKTGSNITAEHPQGVQYAWKKLLKETENTKNTIGFANEMNNGHPMCTYAKSWFDNVYGVDNRENKVLA